ncbi:recombinase family protein [Streptomyces broussonetiae]|uniref:recombinase family protein n=1 Tax=Streptomyces broussonetiae TaxID=2686304 RepID=UPI002278C30A|nr:recombinase family protein [Streptomyces broussonetiae]
MVATSPRWSSRSRWSSRCAGSSACSADCPCHSLQDLINMVAELRDRGIGFTSLHENVDTTTPGGRLGFHVFAALAEFIRELIVIGTNEGLAAARARTGGRPSVATEEVIRAARALLPDPGRSITSIAKLLGVPPGTLYNHIPDLRELRAGAVPRQLEAPTRWAIPSKIVLTGISCTRTTHTRTRSLHRPMTGQTASWQRCWHRPATAGTASDPGRSALVRPTAVRPRSADSAGGAWLVVRMWTTDGRFLDRWPHRAGQHRRALRFRAEAALARRLGVMTRPSVWPTW